jgi:hypothetical protein
MILIQIIPSGIVVVARCTHFKLWLAILFPLLRKRKRNTRKKILLLLPEDEVLSFHSFMFLPLHRTASCVNDGRVNENIYLFLFSTQNFTYLYCE